MSISLYYSFTNFNLQEANFIGFDNYIRMWNDARFWNSLLITLRFVFVSVPIRILFGLFIAYILTRKQKGTYIYRALFYLPTLVGGSISVALVWKQLFARDGVVNNMLAIIGFEGPHWFGNIETAIVPLILMSVWQFGTAMIIFVAGIKNIPSEYSESAEIEGASKWHIFIRITLPCLTPIILFNLVVQTIGAFLTFTQAFVITGGGPAESTNFIALYIYHHAFRWFNMGYASAMSWILLLVIGVIIGIIFKTSKRWTFYVNE
jgi:multiple sugar transport system permease protein